MFNTAARRPLMMFSSFFAIVELEDSFGEIMEDLKNELLVRVRDHAALALHEVSVMPEAVANPQLLIMTDLEKATAQIAALSEMKKDVIKVGLELHALYARIADFLAIDEDQLLSVEELIELGHRLAAERPGTDVAAAGGDARADVEAGGSKYREAIRKAIARTHTGAAPKGGNVFGHDEGDYFLGFYQKSGSTAKELKFSVNKEVITELGASADGHLYLVCKDGLVADILVSDLADKEPEASRWEFFVAVSDDTVTSVLTNKRAHALRFDQFSAGVKGSAD
ncbi:hypothetical protein [Paracoccus sp. ME4]|uniref:hypothetical protein n=1 Tax=Paracoccus sp. ME4 TaxID=3138066 RepID=UPI00398AB071